VANSSRNNNAVGLFLLDSLSKCKKWLRRNAVRLRTIAYWARIAVIIVCIFGGLVYAPFSPIPNGFNTPANKIVTFGKIDFPVQFVYQYLPNGTPFVGCSHTADLTFTLSGDEIVSGKALDILITMTACSVLVNNTNFIFVRMENALEAGFPSSNPINALVLMTDSGYPGFNNFVGSHTIMYSMSGTFTATVIFCLHDGTELPFATGALFPIESQEIIIARQNQALTTSLTFFVLMFAAIEVRIKSHQDYPDKADKKATVHNKSGKDAKHRVRLIKTKVAAKEHTKRKHPYHEKNTKLP